MDHQKIIHLLDVNVGQKSWKMSNKKSKCLTKNRVKVNDDSHGIYSTNNQIKFKTAMLRPSLCNYSDACIFVNGTITASNTAAAGAAGNNINKE